MHLEKVKGVSFDRKIDEIHDSLAPSNLNELKELCSYSIIFTPFVFGFIVWLLGVSAGFAALVGFLTFFVFAYAGNKIFSQGYYLPKNTRRLFLATEAERNDLSNRVAQMNGLVALQQRNYKLLPPAQQYDDTNVAGYMEARCQLLQEKADNFIDRFRTAVSEDLRRAERKNSTDPKYLLRTFRDKAWQLLRLEQSLINTLEYSSDPSEYLSFKTAIKLRRELEQELLELEAIGVSQKALRKALPPRKKQPLQLKGK